VEPAFRPRRFQAKMEHVEGLPESQGQNLALTVLCVPYSLDSGARQTAPPSPFSSLEIVGQSYRIQPDHAVFFEPPDLHHRPPDSGELQCKPRKLKEAISSQNCQAVPRRARVQGS